MHALWCGCLIDEVMHGRYTDLTGSHACKGEWVRIVPHPLCHAALSSGSPDEVRALSLSISPVGPGCTCAFGRGKSLEDAVRR